MLRQRILTAMILIPLALWILLYASISVFFGAALIVAMLISWEWALLMGYPARWMRLTIATVFFALVILLGYCLIIPITWLMLLSLIIIGIIFLGILVYPTGTYYWSHPVPIFMGGVLLSSAFFYSALHLQMGHALLAVMVLVWAADIGAYAVGKLWGTHRLIPLVSPGKSIEGLIGGIIASVVVACMILGWSVFTVVMAMTVSVVSVIGDLLISMLKRQQGLKDTGSLLPGHGGILDRIDSLIPAVTVYLALTQWLQI